MKHTVTPMAGPQRRGGLTDDESEEKLAIQPHEYPRGKLAIGSIGYFLA